MAESGTLLRNLLAATAVRVTGPLERGSRGAERVSGRRARRATELRVENIFLLDIIGVNDLGNVEGSRSKLRVVY